MDTPLLSQHSQTGPWNSLASQSSLTMILQANERPCTHKPRWITSEEQNLHMASGSYTVPTYKCTLTHACACVDVCEYRYSYKFLVGRTQFIPVCVGGCNCNLGLSQPYSQPLVSYQLDIFQKMLQGGFCYPAGVEECDCQISVPMNHWWEMPAFIQRYPLTRYLPIPRHKAEISSYTSSQPSFPIIIFELSKNHTIHTLEQKPGQFLECGAQQSPSLDQGPHSSHLQENLIFCLTP